MREEGVVVDASGTLARVAVETGEHCSHCNLCAVGEDGQRLIEAENTVNASVKDRVSIEVTPGQIVKTSLIVYVVPLLALIGGVIAGNLLSPILGADENLLGIVLGFAALAVGLLLVKVYDGHVARNVPPPARIVNILSHVGDD